MNNTNDPVTVNAHASSEFIFNVVSQMLVDQKIVRSTRDVSAHAVSDILAIAIASYTAEMQHAHNTNMIPHVTKSIDHFHSLFMANRGL